MNNHNNNNIEIAPRQYPRLLSLVVTEKCNLDCVYCFEKNKQNRDMRKEVAFEAVRRHLLDTSDEYHHVQIDFTGGEPLMNFDLIKNVVDFVHENQWTKTFDFAIGTNGTLITPEIEAWAKEHPCVTFGLSFDGVKEAQDTNRSGSYDTVIRHIPFFKQYPSAGVKMTVGPQTVGTIAASIHHIHDLGLDVAANVVFENLWGNEKNQYLKTFDEQLDQLIDFYEENPQLEPPMLVNLPIESLLLPQEAPIRFCGSGENMRAVDVDGLEYPCHRFMPLSNPKATTQADLSFSEVQPEQCKSCVLLPLCPCCIAFNYEENMDVNKRTLHHCEFIKLQALATTKLKYRKMKRYMKVNHPDDCSLDEGITIKKTTDAILWVLKNLN